MMRTPDLGRDISSLALRSCNMSLEVGRIGYSELVIGVSARCGGSARVLQSAAGNERVCRKLKGHQRGVAGHHDAPVHMVELGDRVCVQPGEEPHSFGGKPTASKATPTPARSSGTSIWRAADPVCPISGRPT
jgi:hypothetical protein